RAPLAGVARGPRPLARAGRGGHGLFFRPGTKEAPAGSTWGIRRSARPPPIDADGATHQGALRLICVISCLLPFGFQRTLESQPAARDACPPHRRSRQAQVQPETITSGGRVKLKVRGRPSCVADSAYSKRSRSSSPRSPLLKHH